MAFDAEKEITKLWNNLHGAQKEIGINILKNLTGKIEKGEIKEIGNHKALMKQRGLYYSLYNLQFPEMEIII